MSGIRPLLLLLLLLLPLLAGGLADGEVFTNSWAVEVEGGDEAAEELAVKHGFTNMGPVGSLEGVYHFIHEAVPSRSTRSQDDRHLSLTKEDNVRYAEQQVARKRVKRGEDYSSPQNNLWKKQWYLHRSSHHDMNVELAWEQGITGRGVVVSILDDGLEYNHPDLKDSYDELASYDFNNHDADPIPRYDYSNENKHGTRCAGEVVSRKDGKCGVGAAYGAKVGGVRMLDGDVTDVVESSSLSLNKQHIHIYSSSWGPSDDGKTVDGPGKLAKRAFVDGVTKGRGGLGSIFVWAAGNGGRYGDSCNCDGYAVSPFTISVGSVSEQDNSPWYAEQCSSTLAVTYSSGGGNEQQIVSTDLHHKCTTQHTGTSASAPLAAGILALALEANPELSWRDLQYIIVYSSNPTFPHDSNWHTNGAELKVSHHYGFGVMDATALVNRAHNWISVPPQENCSFQSSFKDKDSKPNSPLSVTVSASDCPLVYLEHAQAITTLQVLAGRRGDIKIKLTSPSGTSSVLLPYRNSDSHHEGFHQWPFLTVHSWGEDPCGDWKLEVETKNGAHASLKELNLVLFGTSQVSRAVRQVPNECHSECKWRCAKAGPEFCDECKHFRMASTLACVPQCPEGTYANAHMCRNCSEFCANCTSSETCTLCQAGTVRLASGLCANQCPELTFLTDDGTCQPCHHSCLKCDGPSQSSCTACPGQFSLEKGACTLLSSCSSGQYFDRRTLECRSCHESCAECIGKENSQCTACFPGFSLSEGLCHPKGHLDSGCSELQYFDQNMLKCVACPGSCVRCLDDITCTKCGSGTFLQSQRVGESHEETRLCVEKCSRGFYGDPSSGSCQPCPSSCDSCFSLTNCTHCTLNSQPVQGQCPQPCQPAQYFNFSTQQCRPCPTNCQLCASEDHCLRCSSGYYLTPHHTCESACPAHMVTNEILGTCEDAQCHSSCLTCYGHEPDQCLSCGSGAILFENTCLQHCPPHTFSNHSSCQHCHRSCASCSGPLRDNCLTCSPGMILSHFHCLEVCPPGSFNSTHSNQPECIACPANCSSCSSVDKCSQCDPGFMLVSDLLTCVSICPPGYAREGQTCQPCPTHCSVCNNHKSCSRCEEHYVYYEPNRSCIQTCPPGYYQFHSHCKECQHPCSQCSKPDKCLSCVAGFVMDTNSSVCRRCCNMDAASNALCCDCDRSATACYLTTPPTQEKPSPKTTVGSGQNGTVIVVLILGVVLLAASLVVGVAGYKYYQRKAHYSKFLPLPNDPLEVLDGDSASEAEIFTRT